MEFTNLLDAKNRRELREWLINNHDKEKECWVIVKRGRPVDENTFWYIDSVEEAMCFGWIDSTTKKMDNGVTAQRLTPRRKGSLWSELNKERCRRMERLGLMTDAGRAVLPDMSPKGFVIDKDIEKALKADAEVWNNFQKYPPLYQRRKQRVYGLSRLSVSVSAEKRHLIMPRLSLPAQGSAPAPRLTGRCKSQRHRIYIGRNREAESSGSISSLV